MAKLIDLTGKTFGKLTVIERGEDQINPSGRKRVRWLCQCECGNTVLVAGESLRAGQSNSCGCGRGEANKKNAAIKDNECLGKAFVDLTVLRRVENRGTNVAYECKCTCGNTCIALRADLISGKKTHCGCKNPGVKHYKDITGQRFGKLVALHPTTMNNRREMQWIFQCDCGNTKELPGVSVTKGNTLSCGCLKMSHGELKITQLLKEANIPYTREKALFTFDNGASARFDFFVDETYVIEYDGEQHYQSNDRWWNTPEYTDAQQERDKIKNQWCKEHNIPIIRIPYTHLKDLSLQDIQLETSNFII